MCCKNDKKITSVFQNLSGEITGWKVYDCSYNIYRYSLELSSPNGWQYKVGGIVRHYGTIESDWVSRDDSNRLFAHYGIHVYLSKEDAMDDVRRYGGDVVEVEIDPQDIIAVGEFWMNDESEPVFYNNLKTDKDKDTIHILVAKKIYLHKKEWNRIAEIVHERELNRL